MFKKPQVSLMVVFAIEGEDDFSHVRKGDFPLPNVLAGALKAWKNDIPVKLVDDMRGT
ncbi:hypothetical protein HanRHA438_Chr13g0591801 [Helianthus annuus]|uniref:Uncharacterized protein n=1 Tax=Helianthus annuus TaxID=4232 RepID=A0A9K3HBT1_HELAN|nr:hypothetical protein HanXRQr2_Chr13g0581061 [Helianthus annuus]KAJ0476352.1 hypothetical protein HanHA300_Chr13g0476451 [Helianthus annuus]KAJ0497169.1 hypothetical protein HanHA89_Chr13g0508471 [Helianthus annuus]KAJ0848590.1 hypothetical protein HanPSC8_Chr13g0559291 [Helianthus annuus]KAJ0857578.1 hypothetical protein HanRHA438_Chr13g0591801 [Helianthus annuus]